MKTKIVCTLGPASEKPAVLLKMMRNGMDVVRLNFSHGRHEEHAARIELVRRLNKKYRRHIRILGDLEGFRVRVGKLKGAVPIEVRKRETVWLTQDGEPGETGGEGARIPLDYDGPLSAIRKGTEIFIDDGTIALVVEGLERKALRTRVVVAGRIKEHKGVNMPSVNIPFKGLSEKDRRDIRFAADNGLDFLAQSFVRTPRDILDVKAALKGRGPAPRLIAKIENRDGIRNINDIIAVSDGIMIARGDMGISIPIWEVPMVQKAIIRRCNEAHKPVITATQMLESMVEHRIPTRAEVTDVANAILDGTDYVMLSAESAVGMYPAETVGLMNQIIKFTEEHRL